MTIPLGSHPVSPCGQQVAAIGPDRIARLYPVEGGEAAPIPGIEVGEEPIQFSAEGRSLYVFRRGAVPARVFRLDVSTGRRDLWREISPTDPAGLQGGVHCVKVSADGQSYAYNLSRFLSELYVAEGLK